MGKYIIIDGDEGAGKTTQVGLLARRLGGLGHDVAIVREPGGEPIGELLRLLLKASPDDENYSLLKNTYFNGMAPQISPLEEVLGFLMARAGMLARVVYPKLALGQIVIADRGTISTLVYQGLAGNVDMTFLRLICDHVTQIAPATTNIVLDVDLLVSQDRLGQRGDLADRFESRGEVYRQKVNDGFRQIAESDLWPLIDANRSVRDVHKDIWSIVRPLL